MKTVIGIATMQGREKYLEKTLESLKGQSDAIHIYHNHKESVDYTDNAKFKPLEQYEDETVYFLTCDDDIIYPSTYVSDMVKAINKHKCIVTHHGRILTGGIGANYYRGHKGFRCNAAIERAQIIDVAGTGVTGFRTDYFCPSKLYKYPIQKMSDLVFSLAAVKNGKQIVILPHSSDYFTIQDVPINQTIYGQESHKCTVQNKLADEIIRTKKGSSLILPL